MTTNPWRAIGENSDRPHFNEELYKRHVMNITFTNLCNIIHLMYEKSMT